MPDLLGKSTGTFPLAVCGLHLSGQPLNHQLTDLRATLARSTLSSADYKLYAISIPAGIPERPGLVRVLEGGISVPLEIWHLPVEAVGQLLAFVGTPLSIGQVKLQDGSSVHGFLCEGYAVNLQGVKDITSHRGWLSYAKCRVEPKGQQGSGSCNA